MRKCPKCDKTYDDSWKVCLACEAELPSNLSDNNIDSGLQNKQGEKHRSPFGKISAFVVILIIARLFSYLSTNAEHSYAKKAYIDFCLKADKMSKAEILQYIKVVELDSINHPQDKEKRNLLEAVKLAGNRRLMKNPQSSETTAK